MSDVRAILKGMNFSQAGYLPVVAEFCRKIGLADTINSAVPTEMVVDVGTVVQFMVLDTLSGRSPLYRLERFASISGHRSASRKEDPCGSVQRHYVGAYIGRHLRGRDRTALLPCGVPCGKGFPHGHGYAACTFRHHLGECVGGLRSVHQRGGPTSGDRGAQQGLPT